MGWKRTLTVPVPLEVNELGSATPKACLGHPTGAAVYLQQISHHPAPHWQGKQLSCLPSEMAVSNTLECARGELTPVD